jgi:hypothetical protein
MQKIRERQSRLSIIFTASGRLSTGTQVVNATANSNNLVGTVGTFLQDTLKVRVLDKLGFPRRAACCFSRHRRQQPV